MKVVETLASFKFAGFSANLKSNADDTYSVFTIEPMDGMNMSTVSNHDDIERAKTSFVREVEAMLPKAMAVPNDL